VANDTITDWEDEFPVSGVDYTTGMNLILNETVEDDWEVEYDDDGNEIEDPNTYSVMGDKSVNLIIGGDGKDDTNLWEEKELVLTGIRCLYNCNDAVEAVDDDIVRTTYYWSDDDTWTGDVAYPQTGDDFTVPADWDLIIDIEETPVIKHL